MSLPGYSAEASIYQSTTHYHAMMSWRAEARAGIGPAQLLAPPIINGGGCKPHIGPCTIVDPTCLSGKARVIQDTDCNIDQVCCPPICLTTCTLCSGGSCNPWPNCGVANPGTKICTDCHG